MRNHVFICMYLGSEFRVNYATAQVQGNVDLCMNEICIWNMSEMHPE